MANPSPACLSDHELESEVTRLAATERRSTVELIVHLAEFDARQLYRRAGFFSTFEYCLKVLHLSEDAASNRIAAARMARRYPHVAQMLVEGALSPTTARMIAAHITTANQRELLSAASRRTKREVEELLARMFPQPDVPSSVRLLSVPVAPVFRATSAEMYEIRLGVGEDTVDKLRLAQDLLSHAVPNGDLSQVFDRALSVLVEQLVRRKFGVTGSPRKTGARDPRDADEPPAHVKREVYLRDRGRCTYVAPEGRRCDSRRFLQFDHIVPRAMGGKGTPDNLRLRCGPHNRLAAEGVLGHPPRGGYAHPDGTGCFSVAATDARPPGPTAGAT